MTDILRELEGIFFDGVTSRDQANDLLVRCYNAIIDLQAQLPKPKSEGKWGMARLWRSWMESTAEYMAFKGAVMPMFIDKDGTMRGERKFNKQDAHELFTIKWLGTDNKGSRLSWARKPADGETIADQGQRFHALQRHEQWMTERGIKFINPREGEFASLCAMADGLN